MWAAVPFSVSGSGLGEAPIDTEQEKSGAVANPLKPPSSGSIPVAFVISEGLVVIDFAGPWEVFKKAKVAGRSGDAFRLYTVAASTDLIRVQTGGMKILPEYTFDNAPPPKVIVIPAQDGSNHAMLNWIRKSAKDADLTMSVCVGSYVLARTGLLSGKPATTFHQAYNDFASTFPDIQVKRGVRLVESGNLATSGGLSSGIDLALRVTERYFGRESARQTAFYLEYQSEGWMNPDANQIYNPRYHQTDQHTVCPVCGMQPSRSFKSVYKEKTYYFCSQDHKSIFDRDPHTFING